MTYVLFIISVTSGAVTTQEFKNSYGCQQAISAIQVMEPDSYDLFCQPLKGAQPKSWDQTGGLIQK